MKVFQTLGLVLALATPAFGQQFTTAEEVKPILDATKANWIAVREFDGQDLLYFTHLMAWRCGLDQIYYALNGGDEQRWNGEPCYEGEAQPNAIKASDVLPFVALPLGSVQSVTVRLEYDDGSIDSATYQRRDVLTN